VALSVLGLVVVRCGALEEPSATLLRYSVKRVDCKDAVYSRNGSNLEEIVKGFIGGLLKPPPSYVPQNVPRRYAQQELTTLNCSGQPTKNWVPRDEFYKAVL
jgi:hypothetical protein